MTYTESIVSCEAPFWAPEPEMGGPFHLAGRLSAGRGRGVRCEQGTGLCVAGGHHGHLVTGPGFLSMLQGMPTVSPADGVGTLVWPLAEECRSAWNVDLAAGRSSHF